MLVTPPKPTPRKFLTERTLETILNVWAVHLSRSKDFNYTKADANIALRIKNEIKRLKR